jgi:MFS family permease
MICFGVLCFCTVLVCVPGSMLSPAFFILATEFNVSLTKISQSSGLLVLLAAPSLWISAAIVPYYGKRPLFLFSVLILFASLIWGAEAKSYGSFLAARAIQGFACGP